MGKRRMGQQALQRVCAIAHPQASHPGVARHLQIKTGVSYHQGTLRAHAYLIHQLMDHLGVRLGMALVHTTGCMKIMPYATVFQGTVQARPPLARGHRQCNTAAMQLGNRFRCTVKQGNLVFACLYGP